MKIIFAGGGTGGHLFTGVALAEAYLREPMAQKEDLLFVGTALGLENRLIPELGYRLAFIPVKPLKGKSGLDRVRSLLQIPASFFKARKLLKQEKPKVVIGIGGYASGPVTLMAHFMRIPTCIVEQNSYPGMTNRILGKWVDRIFIAFENARKFFPAAKVVMTGNPVRQSFLSNSASATLPSSEKTFTLLVLGGSQGARSINQAMIQAIPRWQEMKGSLKIIHQTGKADFEEVKRAYANSGLDVEVFDFIQNVSSYYKIANLVVSRAGAGTLTELQNLGKAAILIPYPYAADDHQRVNASELADQGAAEMILNAELNAERLFQAVIHLKEHPELIKNMSEKALALSKPEAAQHILKICKDFF
ncbi:MAG: undecaprenyldiphospho-muramoylpentapeptide beta-N-acetylglucosaminyltransferase [Deltaproteobacteria bacterium]|nr:undecaprenyldiphospho-muramoylpentapeptide beta-N-acetylglucosaminyltransferase [Deltaproteobacteria bacterium]